MTHEQRNAAIIKLIRDHRAANDRSPERARASLMATGIYHPDGTLRAEFGGPGWQKLFRQ